MNLTNNEILTWRWSIGEVTEGLFIGGDLPQAEDEAVAHLERWVTSGVTHVIDVRGEWSDEGFVEHYAPWVRYFHLGTDDDGGQRPEHWFRKGVLAARAADGGGLLVHCHMGINRGPSMALAILLSRDWDLVEALDSIRAARPIAAIAYAEDAVRFHFSPQGSRKVAGQVRRVRRWHDEHGIDVHRVIRRIRQAENQTGDAA